MYTHREPVGCRSQFAALSDSSVYGNGSENFLLLPLGLFLPPDLPRLCCVRPIVAPQSVAPQSSVPSRVCWMQDVNRRSTRGGFARARLIAASDQQRGVSSLETQLREPITQKTKATALLYRSSMWTWSRTFHRHRWQVRFSGPVTTRGSEHRTCACSSMFNCLVERDRGTLGVVTPARIMGSADPRKIFPCQLEQ